MLLDTVSGMISLLKCYQGANNRSAQPLVTVMSIQSILKEIERRTREEFGGIADWQLPPSIHAFRYECTQWLLDYGCADEVLAEIEGKSPRAMFAVLEREYLK